MQEKIKQALLSNQAKTAYWQIANGLIIIAIAVFSELNAAYIPFLLAGLNMATKEINKRINIR